MTAARLLGVAVAVGCAVEYRLPDVEPRCPQPCLADTVCVDGECVRDCEDGCDASREHCDAEFGACECRAGLNACAGFCANLETDFDHCGACFRRCEDGQACGAGVCVPEACSGFPDVCFAGCTDLQSDILNCGDCDRTCLVDEVCVEGRCVPFDPLDPAQCNTCPCAQCDDEGAVCCFHFLLEEDVCVFFDECP